MGWCRRGGEGFFFGWGRSVSFVCWFSSLSLDMYHAMAEAGRG